MIYFINTTLINAVVYTDDMSGEWLHTFYQEGLVHAKK